MQPHPSSSAHKHGTPYSVHPHTPTRIRSISTGLHLYLCQAAWSIVTGAFFFIWSGSVRGSGRNRPAGLPTYQLLRTYIHVHTYPDPRPQDEASGPFRFGPSPVATAPSDPIYGVRTVITAYVGTYSVHGGVLGSWAMGSFSSQWNRGVGSMSAGMEASRLWVPSMDHGPWAEVEVADARQRELMD